MFHIDFPLAWAYHRNTSLWPMTPVTSGAFPDDFEPYKEYPAATLIRLGSPALPEVSLGEVLRLRASTRDFAPEPIALAALATLLHAGYGLNPGDETAPGAAPRRNVPSGGALYPLELYMLSCRVSDLDGGVYHYHPVDHALELLEASPVPGARLPSLFLNQSYLESAAAILVITATPARSLWKYGDRGYRYALIEAGHVAHGIGLAAAAMEIGCLNLGGFHDADLANMLELDLEREIPLYAIAIGTPASTPAAGA